MRKLSFSALFFDPSTAVTGENALFFLSSPPRFAFFSPRFPSSAGPLTAGVQAARGGGDKDTTQRYIRVNHQPAPPLPGPLSQQRFWEVVSFFRHLRSFCLGRVLKRIMRGRATLCVSHICLCQMWDHFPL